MPSASLRSASRAVNHQFQSNARKNSTKMSSDNSSHLAYRLLRPLASGQSAGDAAKCDVTKAVSELTRLVEQSSLPGGDSVDDVLWDTWNAVFQVAADTRHQSQNDGLVDFMTQLRKTTVFGPDGATVLANENCKVWDDIPQFGWVARDIWNFSELCSIMFLHTRQPTAV